MGAKQFNSLPIYRVQNVLDPIIYLFLNPFKFSHCEVYSDIVLGPKLNSNNKLKFNITSIRNLINGKKKNYLEFFDMYKEYNKLIHLNVNLKYHTMKNYLQIIKNIVNNV